MTTAIAAGLVDKWGRKPLICLGLLTEMVGLLAVVVGFMALDSRPDIKVDQLTRMSCTDSSLFLQPWVIFAGIGVFIAGFEAGTTMVSPD